MKMLFYSPDLSEVQLASQEFQNAGIPCEIRSSPVWKGHAVPPPCSELWITNDKDSHRAFMLCVQLGIGFSRRHHFRSPLDLESMSQEEEKAPEVQHNAA